MKNIIIFCLFITSVSFSQVRNANTESNKKVKLYKADTVASPTYKWILKTDVVSIATGEFPLIAEFRISDDISLEGSAGVTFGKNNDSDLSNIEYFSDASVALEGKSSLGTAFRAGVKYYISNEEDAVEGFSVGLFAFNKITKEKYVKEAGDFDYSVNGKFDTKNKLGLELVLAYQYFWNKHIGTEFFLGLGAANIKREFYSTQVLSDGMGGTYQDVKYNDFNEFAENIRFGIKIGFGN